MIRQTLLAALIALPFAIPTTAQDHDHEASTGTITVIHPWARAAAAGSDTMVFFEIDNAGEAVDLTGAQTDIATSVQLVGATLGADADRAYQPVGTVRIAPGHFALEPDALGFALSGLTQDLAQGDDFELDVSFGNGASLHLHIEVEAPDANQHSHAGHAH